MHTSKFNLVLPILLILFASSSGSMADEPTFNIQLKALQDQIRLQGEQIQALRNPAGRIDSDTTIGGYGEASYVGYTADSSRNQADLKRFVLFLGHRFSDILSFNSEVEWEHAVTSAEDQGETEIEQAFLSYQLNSNFMVKTGLFLMPFGFLNQSHEPPVFFGVERNEVETRIIPSTWREGGVGLSGSSDLGLDWNVGLTTGFDLAKFDDASAPLRSSHQELQYAKAHDLAYYGALNYKGLEGTLGSSLFIGNGIQGNADYVADTTQPNFSGISGQIVLWDLHARWQKKGWDLQALYAHGSIGEADRIDAVLKTYNAGNSTDRAYVPSEFYGWMFQGAYTLWQEGNMSFTPFVRLEKYNTQSVMPSGFSSDSANADQVLTLGFSFKPLDAVVYKVDYQIFNDHSDNNRFNLGMGYMF